MPRRVYHPTAASIVASVALTACAGAPSPAPATATAAAAPAPPPPPGPRGEIHLATPVGFERAFEVERDASGILRAFLGGYRAEIQGDQVRWADERFLRPLIAAARGREGWLFLSVDGVVARAPTYLGPLTRVGEIDTDLRDAGYSHGRLAAVDARGRAWSTDGSAPPAVLPLPREVRARSAVFSSESVGVALLDGGGLLRTADGGQTWARVDLGSEAAIAIDLVGEALRVDTTAGPRAVDARGALGPWAGGDVATLPDAIEQQLVVSRLQRHPELMQRAFGVVRGPGGEAYLLLRGRVLVLDGATAALRTVHEGALAERCHLQGGGPVLTAWCADAAELTTWRSEDGGATWQRAPEAPREPRISDDGQHAWAPRPCPGDGDEAREAICVTSDAWAHRRSLEVKNGPPYAGRLRGASLLFQREDDRGNRWLAVLDIDRGEVRPVAAPASPPDGLFMDLQWTGNGQVAAAMISRGAAEDEPGTLYLGPVEGPMVARALPPGARSVGFLDAQHGYATGRTLAQLWQTVDAGASWTPVPVTVDGDATKVMLLAFGNALDCTAEACAAGQEVVLRGWRDLSPSSERALVSNQEAERVPLVFPAGPPMRRLACEPDPHPPARRRIPHMPSAMDTDVRAFPSGGVEAFMFRWEREDGDGSEADAYWQGRDERGEFVAHARRGPEPEGEVSRSDEDDVFTARAATRSALLFTRCAPPAFARCDTIWASRGGVMHLLADPGPGGGVPVTGAVSDAIPAPDGGMLVLHRRALPRSTRQDTVRLLGPDGSVRARREFVWAQAWDAGRSAMLGRHAGLVGYVVHGRDDARSLWFYPVGAGAGAEAVELPRVAEHASVCAGAPARDATVIHGWPWAGGSTDLVTLPGERPGRVGDLRVRLEVSAAGTCVRAVEDYWPTQLTSDGADQPATWALHVDAVRGGLVGEANGAGGPVAVRCSVE